jgi:hypothetical protein
VAVVAATKERQCHVIERQQRGMAPMSTVLMATMMAMMAMT